MVKGDIVLIKFPFIGLKGSKLSPAVVLADTKLDLTFALSLHKFSLNSKLLQLS